MIDVDYYPKIVTVGRAFEFSVELSEKLAIFIKPRVVLRGFEDGESGGSCELPDIYRNVLLTRMRSLGALERTNSKQIPYRPHAITRSGCAIPICRSLALVTPAVVKRAAFSAGIIPLFFLPPQVFLRFPRGFGKVAGKSDGTLEYAAKNKNLYPYLVDENGGWTVRKDVRNVRVMGSPDKMRTFNNEWLTIKGRHIGPEIGIGHYLGEATDAPVMVLKACIGNRCLGWDLLPPGSERFEYGGKIHAGYKDSYSNVKGPWEPGTQPEKPDGGKWYAGWQYDIDVALAKKVLAELDKYYPGAKNYEVAGFFWWQGDKDRGRPQWYTRYETNLVQLFKALRNDFDAPDARFVCATLGQTDKDNARGAEKHILEAMFAISNPDKHAELKGETATVYTHPLSRGSSSSAHYGGNAETYMNVGEAMGKAMVKLLTNH